jgi:glycosyltransferase involved in cell wall biosynthesis
MAPYLSVVIIARNEAAYIERALASVFEAVRGTCAEAILVDSASTDGTVALARGFPVEIVRLEPGWFLSPAAGRYVGLNIASGEYVFLLDGDTSLEPGFLEAALPILEADRGLAGILGKRRELTLDGGKVRVACEDAYRIDRPRVYRLGDKLGGSGLYRTSALREVGGFNPWLCANEEAELVLRLYDAGYRLLMVPQPMISHLDHRPPSVDELRRRWRENLLVGLGQVVRLHPFRRHLYKGMSKTLSMFACLLALPLLAAVVLVMGQPRLLLVWPAGMAALYVIFVARGRSLTKPLFYAAVWALSGLKIGQGFLKTPRDPTDYPLPAPAARGTGNSLQGEIDERPVGGNRLLEGR